MKLKSFELNLV